MNVQVQLRQAIEQLFLPGAPPASLQAANRFLFEVNESKECFFAALHLISNEKDFRIAHFAVNLLYNKIRKHWNQLDENEKILLFNSILQLVGVALPLLENKDFKAFCTRLAYAFSAISIRIPSGVEKYRTMAFDVLQSGLPSSFALGLDMFSILHEELDSSDISRSLKTEVEEELAKSMGAVIEKLQGVSDEQLAHSENLCSVLQVIFVFVKNGTTLTTFRQRHNRLLSFVLHFLFVKDEEVVTKGHAIIQALVATNEYPKSTESVESKQALAAYLIPQIQQVYSSFRTLDIDIAQEQVWMVRELAQTVMAIVGGEFEAILGGNAQYRQLFELLLPLLSLRPRSVMMLSFDFWVDVEMIEDPDPDRFLCEKIVKPLIQVLLEHCTFSREYGDWSDGQLNEDQEDFLQFRDVRLGVQELMMYCFDQLGMNLFPFLQSKVESFQADARNWMDFEVVLFTLHCVMDGIKKKLEHVNQMIALDGSKQFLLFLAQLCYSIDPQSNAFANKNQMGILMESVCKFLGCITFLLIGNGNNALDYSQGAYAACTKFCLMLSLDHREQLSLAAAKSFHKLCVHGMKTVSADAISLIQDCIHYFAESYNPQMNGKSILLVIESLTRTSLEIHPNQQAAIDKLGDPVLRITAAYNSSPGCYAVEHIVAVLSYCSQMIRFCDASPKHASPHYLLHFVTQLWPMMNQLQGLLQSSSQAMEVFNICFEIYGRILTSLGAEAFSEVLNVRNLIIATVQNRRGYSAAAISCASTLFDFIINKIPDVANQRELLSPLFFEIGQAFVGSVSSSAILADNTRMFVDISKFSEEFGFEPEAFDEYFRFLYRALLSWRNGLFGCQNIVQQMLIVSIGTMRSSAERDPLRNLFSVLQAFFSPPLHSIQKADFDQRLQYDAVQESLDFSNQIITLLILNLSPGRLNSAIIPNVADAIVSVINGLLEIPHSGCRDFLQAIVCDTRSLCPSIDLEHRQLISSALCVLAQRQQRRGKAMLMDIYKICASESTVDVLVAYADAVM